MQKTQCNWVVTSLTPKSYIQRNNYKFLLTICNQLDFTFTSKIQTQPNLSNPQNSNQHTNPQNLSQPSHSTISYNTQTHMALWPTKWKPKIPWPTCFYPRQVEHGFTICSVHARLPCDAHLIVHLAYVKLFIINVACVL